MISCGLLWAIFKNVITIYSQKSTLNSNFCNVCPNYPFLSYKSSLTTALICLPCRVVSVLGTTYIPTSSSSSASLPDNDRSELACVSQKSRKLFGAGVRFSKVLKTSRTRKVFGVVFGRISRVPESVSQSAWFSPEIFGDVFGKCNARNSVSFNFPAFDWFKNCNWHRCTELGSSRTHQIQDFFDESPAKFYLWRFVQF